MGRAVVPGPPPGQNGRMDERDDYAEPVEPPKQLVPFWNAALVLVSSLAGAVLTAVALLVAVRTFFALFD